jgi:hypothetical protein
MKRTFLILMALVLSLALASTALAASTTNPPKTLCFACNGTFLKLSLVTKTAGTVQTTDGKVKFYALHGEASGNNGSFPLSGTGHVQGGIFHFSVSGSMKYTDDVLYNLLLEGKWDLATGTGTYMFYSVQSDGTSSTFSGTLGAIDCGTNITIPYSAEGEGPFGIK